MVAQLCIFCGSSDIRVANLLKKRIPLTYTIYIRYRPDSKFPVFLYVSLHKAVCARTTIFSVLHTICVSSVFDNFGLSTATIRCLLRYLKIAIFEYSCKSCITTWQAEIFFDFFARFARCARYARSASVFSCLPAALASAVIICLFSRETQIHVMVH